MVDVAGDRSQRNLGGVHDGAGGAVGEVVVRLVAVVRQVERETCRSLCGGKPRSNASQYSGRHRQVDEVGRVERADHPRPLELAAFDQGIGVDRVAVDELGLVGVERELEDLAGIKAAEGELDLRAAVDDRDAGDGEALVTEDRKADVAERAEAARLRCRRKCRRWRGPGRPCRRRSRAGERRAGGTAFKRDLDHIRPAVVASRFFEIDRAQQDLRRDVARHQPAFFQ